jgi:3-phosphoshikimate 1-carboxyvinyltransferase
MTDWTIRGVTHFSGEVTPPGDKSVSHRAVILGALADGETRIRNFLPSDDCRRTLQALQAMGLQSEATGASEIAVVGGELKEPEVPLDMGNSGTGVRLLAGVLSGQPFLSIVTGDASIRKRPMKRVCEPLRKMGATILARRGDLAPLAIRGGGLHGIDYESPVASAQVKSALLLAGLFAEEDTSVTEPSLSRDHTERMLRAFGADLTRQERSVTLKPGQPLKGRTVEVPGDLSSAAFFIVGALITPDSELRVVNVGLNPTRTGLLDALKVMGADITLSDEREVSGEPVGAILVRSSTLHGAEFGGEVIPRMIDEVPALAVAAAFADGDTVIRDAAELRVKESDRIASVSELLTGLGAAVQTSEDGMVIHGGRGLSAGCSISYGDHRLAMAAAIAAAASNGESLVRDVDCVQTSFPSFKGMFDRVTS